MRRSTKTGTGGGGDNEPPPECGNNVRYGASNVTAPTCAA